MDSPPTGYYAKWATPIFVEKTFTNVIRSEKFVKVFSLKSFPLYGTLIKVHALMAKTQACIYIIMYLFQGHVNFLLDDALPLLCALSTALRAAVIDSETPLPVRALVS